MDFTNTYYAGAQPYQYMSIPPLTPSHSNSTGSEEYQNHSPPETFEQFQNNDQFQNFDQFAQHFSQQPQSQAQAQAQAQPFPGPPGPPTPPTHPLHAQKPNGVAIKNHQAELLPMTKVDPDNSRNGSNSDEDDMTPAQSRRKAQNRAAQRAFRERKEQHVKNLEAQLATLEASQHQTVTENEKLRRDLQKMSTENEILRATSSMQSQKGSMSPAGPTTTTGPMHYSPTDFYSDLLANHTNKTPSHRVVESEAGERLLAAGATWDIIINHELFKRGLVDVGDVSERLKPQAKCDGQGPVYEERAILEAIQASVASGSDELL